MDMTVDNPDDLRAKRKRLNRALLLVLVGMVGLFYLVSLVRMGFFE
jgi:hypothetical protein